MRSKQLSLFKDPRRETKLWWIRKQQVYGGSLDYRKIARPLDSKKLTHAVFKAKLGKAIWFTQSQRSIARLTTEVASRCDVKIHDLAINKDHIHVVFYSKHRDDQIRFLRLLAAELGRKYRQIRKNLGVTAAQPLWVARPFTRLIAWGKKSLQRIRSHLRKNRDEAMGFVEYSPRRHRLSAFLKQWQLKMNSA